MYVCMYVCMYEYIYIYVYIYLFIVFIYLSIYIFIYTHVYIYVNICIYTYICRKERCGAPVIPHIKFCDVLWIVACSFRAGTCSKRKMA